MPPGMWQLRCGQARVVHATIGLMIFTIDGTFDIDWQQRLRLADPAKAGGTAEGKGVGCTGYV